MCNQFRKDLGKCIRDIRLSKKITQETLALESMVSRSHIAMVEVGKRDVTLSTLFKISRALGVDLKNIFSFDNIEKYKFDVEKFYS